MQLPDLISRTCIWRLDSYRPGMQSVKFAFFEDLQKFYGLATSFTSLTASSSQQTAKQRARWSKRCQRMHPQAQSWPEEHDKRSPSPRCLKELPVVPKQLQQHFLSKN